MYENIFKRVEEKYILTPEQYLQLFDSIQSNIQKDKYYESTICNIYFDTLNSDLIINSIEKPIFKEKVRLRSYGVPSLTDDVFLEIKSKYKKTVGKRRIKLKLIDFYTYLDTGKMPTNDQIMKEIDYLFNIYNLKPSYFLAYDRKSYRGIDNPTLRITIDANLRSRNDHLNLELSDMGHPFFNTEVYIMEIKNLGSMPLWLVNTLSSLKIYPISFSKIR